MAGNNDNDTDSTGKKESSSGANSGGKKLSSSKAIPIQYPMLSESNYGIWAVNMKLILRSLGVLSVIEGDKEDANAEKDQDAMVAIAQAIPDSILMSLAEYETAKEA